MMQLLNDNIQFTSFAEISEENKLRLDKESENYEIKMEKLKTEMEKLIIDKGFHEPIRSPNRVEPETHEDTIDYSVNLIEDISENEELKMYLEFVENIKTKQYDKTSIIDMYKLNKIYINRELFHVAILYGDLNIIKEFIRNGIKIYVNEFILSLYSSFEIYKYMYQLRKISLDKIELLFPCIMCSDNLDIVYEVVHDIYKLPMQTVDIILSYLSNNDKFNTRYNYSEIYSKYINTPILTSYYIKRPYIEMYNNYSYNNYSYNIYHAKHMNLIYAGTGV
jgi:hypothetical protein